MKKLLLILSFILVFTLASCTKEPLIEENLLLDTKTSLTIPQSIEEYQLPTELNGVSISWTSNEIDTITSSFMTIQQNDDNEVTLTAILEYNGAVLTKLFNVTIIGLHEEVIVIYEDYYLGADNLEGQALKTFLNQLIDDHTVISYGGLRDALQNSDEDPNNPNNIILLYTGNSIPSTWDSSALPWNREHTWPKSHGTITESNPAYSDMHHLRPTLPSVNQDRGNLDFDIGGELAPNTTDCYSDHDSWEPRDEVKGDIARMMFYMAVRYESDDMVDLEINNSVNNSGSPFIGKLSILLQWHLEDPVDDFERNRNDVIFSYQGNRNPFIDHPEFVELIWN